MQIPIFKHGFELQGLISNAQFTPVVPGKHVSQLGPVKLPAHVPIIYYNQKKSKFKIRRMPHLKDPGLCR